MIFLYHNEVHVIDKPVFILDHRVDRIALLIATVTPAAIIIVFYFLHVVR